MDTYSVSINYPIKTKVLSYKTQFCKSILFGCFILFLFNHHVSWGHHFLMFYQYFLCIHWFTPSYSSYLLGISWIILFFLLNFYYAESIRLPLILFNICGQSVFFCEVFATIFIVFNMLFHIFNFCSVLITIFVIFLNSRSTIFFFNFIILFSILLFNIKLLIWYLLIFTSLMFFRVLLFWLWIIDLWYVLLLHKISSPFQSRY